MRQKGMEKDRIVGKNRIEGRRTDGNRRRRMENVREEILRDTYYDAYLNENMPCALVNWFVLDGDEPDEATGMWVVRPEYEGRV